MVRYIYDAWGNHAVVDNNGNEVTEGIGALNPFRYRGYYYDIETGLYYLKTRYYDPETGRFITIDGISYLDPESINGLNLYAYCANNPVMKIDPDGTIPRWLKWLLAGLLVVAAVALIAVSTVVTGGASLVLFGMGAGIAMGSVAGAVTAGVLGYDPLDGFLIGGAIGLGIGAIVGSAAAAAPIISGFLNSTLNIAFMNGAGEAVLLTLTGKQLVGSAIALAGIHILFSKLPLNGGPKNGTLSNENSTGYYDENGNLIERIDLKGKPHFLKDIGEFRIPHTHHYRWDFIKNAWRIIKKWITP